MAPCGFTIAGAHITKAQVICARSKESVSCVFRFLWLQHEHKKQNWQWIFSRFLQWIFFLKFGSVVANSYKYPIFVKICQSWQITEYWKSQPFLSIQNVRQYDFHDVAKYEKISPKESINIKEFRPKWGLYLPVIRWDVAMVTALIQELTTKKRPYFNSTYIGKSLQWKL